MSTQPLQLVPLLDQPDPEEAVFNPNMLCVSLGLTKLCPALVVILSHHPSHAICSLGKQRWC